MYVQASVHLPLGPVVGLDVGACLYLYFTRVDEISRALPVGQAHLRLAVGLGGAKIQRARRDRP